MRRLRGVLSVVAMTAVCALSGCNSITNMGKSDIDIKEYESRTEENSSISNIQRVNNYAVNVNYDSHDITEKCYITGFKTEVPITGEDAFADDSVTVTVQDCKVTDSLDDISDFAEKNESAFVNRIIWYHRNPLINTYIYNEDDGTITMAGQGSAGMKASLIMFKETYKNNSDNEVIMNMSMMDIVYIDKENHKYIDVLDNYEVLYDAMYDENETNYRSYYTLKPHEEFETVVVYIIPEKQINSYRVVDGYNTVDIKATDYDFDNMYLRCRVGNKNEFKEGEYFIALKPESQLKLLNMNEGGIDHES